MGDKIKGSCGAIGVMQLSNTLPRGIGPKKPTPEDFVRAALEAAFGISGSAYVRFLLEDEKRIAAIVARVVGDTDMTDAMLQAAIKQTDLCADLVRAGYLAGLEAVSKHLVGIIASHKAMGAHGTYPTLRETTLKSVSTLPIDPEAIAAIVASVTEGK